MQQSQPADSRELHRRAPRIWPIIPDEPIIVPYIKPESSPQLSSLFVTGASVLGIGVATLFLRGSSGALGGLGIGMLAVSGVTALVSGMVAAAQFMRSRSRNGRLLTSYTTELDRLDGSPAGASQGAGVKEGSVRRALREEAEARRANDLPLVQGEAHAIAGYSLPLDAKDSRIAQARAHPGTLWQRRPGDPDFLAVRVGVGQARPQTQVRLSEQSAGWTVGYVYLPALVLIVIASMSMAPLGARTAYRVPVKTLRVVFAILIGAMALRTLATLW